MSLLDIMFRAQSNPMQGVRRPTQGAQPIHFAASTRTIVTMYALGCDGMTALDSNGNTPLHYVTNNEPTAASMVLIHTLLGLGADPSASNRDGVLAPMYCIGYDAPRHLELFLQEWTPAGGGSDLVKGKTGGGRCRRLAEDPRLLQHAVSCNSLHCLHLLVSYGAPVKTAALQWATSTSENRLKGVQFLLDHGASLELRDERDGSTPLMSAARRGDAAMVSYLLERGARRNVIDKQGRTAAQIAALWGHHSVVEILVNKGKASLK